MKAVIKKVRIVNQDGKREYISLSGVPGKKETDIDLLRAKIKAYTNAKYVHLEYETDKDK